ncbi:beta-galactosidase [Paenibacillus sp. 8b26]|uniref:beta-galactosidase n=1 Tax=Paenibacillus sp. 8b26 TaxID=3424133 RepID=UPI003D658197
MKELLQKNEVFYKLDQKDKEIRQGKLSGHGGENPQGEAFDFTSYYMTHNGKPFIPVVGEFHFSRFAYLQWEEELLKMKAGGVNIIASYVFWNFHEEEEGVFNWSGDLNLRHFVDLCSKHDLPLIMRIGPFCHGEVRNGGLPDWIFNYPFEVRSNDEGYLHFARRLYREIARQLKGCYFQEGGPIIAVQLENEYMHCGAPLDAWGYKSGKYITSGRDGKEHLAELRRIAEEAGIQPLFFTVTAWGGAAVPEEGTLPMLAGYAYTPWIPNQPPSREYLFRDLHLCPAEPVDYDTLDYPAAYCELAGGMQVSYNARPYVPASSVEAMTVVKLANGSNLVGYYMYHGGSNPIGKKTFMNEHALPKITYDYQSPLGEFGRIGESYDRIRSIAMFLDAFGGKLAPMGSVIPEGQQELVPENTVELRWSVRQREGRGFVFLNNFQDHISMPEREVSLVLETARGQVRFPSEGTFKLGSGTAAILPFNLNIYGIEIISATVQPLTLLDHEHTAVFYAHEGIVPEYVISKATFSMLTAAGASVVEGEKQWVIRPRAGREHEVQLTNQNGQVVRLLTLTRKEALQAYRFSLWGQERLVISSAHLHEQKGQLNCTTEGNSQMRVSMFPAPDHVSGSSYADISNMVEGVFRTYDLKVEEMNVQMEINYPTEQTAVLQLPGEWPKQVEDIFLHIDYEGDVAAAFIRNVMLTDHIQYGHTWEIGLKNSRLELLKNTLNLSITPVRKGTTQGYVNQAYIERFEGIEIGKFEHIRAVPHYRAVLYKK